MFVPSKLAVLLLFCLLSLSTRVSANKEDKKKMSAALAKVQDLIKRNSVIVFSKTYCPYCKKVKTLFTQNNVDFEVVELDEEKDGADMQAALGELTGRRTVPNVFLDGKSIGGSDDTFKLHDNGKLMPKLQALGVVGGSKKKSEEGSDRPEL